MDSAFQTAASTHVTVRRYVASDLRACAELAAQAWPSKTFSMSWNDQVAGMEGYMMSTLAASTWAEVLEESGRVVGFLYGRIDKHWKTGTRLMPKRSSFPAVFAFTAARRERPLWFLRMMWHIAMTELKLYLNRPRSDAEITMLIVDAAHRRKGYGRRLVERFIDVARAAGASTIMVYTDDQSSNWGFYERLGFARTAEFFDNMASFWVGRPAKGIIYLLTLESTQIQMNVA